ncbi:MAG: fmt [Acidobacteria bacterium]|nr:fmt [Acidobacteriota bacterium]
MNVLFFGTPDWAVPSLEALAASSHRVVAIVTAPDAPSRRSRTPQPPPVKRAAGRLGLGPVLQPATLRGDAAREPLLAFAPDALAVVAYGRILPGRLLDAPPLGGVNLHFSLLPRHRGASPVQHTLWAGDALAGVTTMRMERGLDTGPTYFRSAVPVEPDEDAVALGARLARLGAPLLVETLDRLAAGGVVPEPQDPAQASWAPLLTRAMGVVDWNGDAAEIARRVRAFVPWPPVVARGAKGALRLLRATALGETAPPGVVPGAVLRRAGDAIDVVCGEGLLRIVELQPEGGRPMTAAAALAGRHVELGGRLERWAGP